MIAMAPTYPPEMQSRRVRLEAGPAAVPEARSQVRAAIRSWKASVDSDTAVLLTSELVTNAIRYETGPAVRLVITWSSGELRVDVYDTSCSLPAVADVPADAETGRGLLLVAALLSSLQELLARLWGRMWAQPGEQFAWKQTLLSCLN